MPAFCNLFIFRAISFSLASLLTNPNTSFVANLCFLANHGQKEIFRMNRSRQREDITSNRCNLWVFGLDADLECLILHYRIHWLRRSPVHDRMPWTKNTSEKYVRSTNMDDNYAHVCIMRIYLLSHTIALFPESFALSFIDWMMPQWSCPQTRRERYNEDTGDNERPPSHLPWLPLYAFRSCGHYLTHTYFHWHVPVL